MKTKTFDCVQMKRRAAERIHQKTKALSFNEKVAYWRRRSEAFQAEQNKLMQKPPSAS